MGLRGLSRLIGSLCFKSGLSTPIKVSLIVVSDTTHAHVAGRALRSAGEGKLGKGIDPAAGRCASTAAGDWERRETLDSSLLSRPLSSSRNA